MDESDSDSDESVVESESENLVADNFSEAVCITTDVHEQTEEDPDTEILEHVENERSEKEKAVKKKTVVAPSTRTLRPRKQK